MFRIVHKNLVPVQVRNNEPTIQVDKNDSNDAMSVQVLGEMPKVVKFEGETIIQVLLFVLFLFYIIYNTKRNYIYNS